MELWVDFYTVDVYESFTWGKAVGGANLINAAVTPTFEVYLNGVLYRNISGKRIRISMLLSVPCKRKAHFSR